MGENRRYYRAKAHSWVFGKTSAGKPQVAVSFDVLVEVPENEKRLTWYGHFTDLTFNRTIEALQHMGWVANPEAGVTGEDLRELDEGGPGRLDVNEVDLVVEDEEYQGNWSVKVQFVNRAGSGAAVKDRMEPGEVASFAQQVRRKIRAMKAGSGQPVAAPQRQAAPARAAAPARSSTPRPSPAMPPAQPEPPPLQDDDIPF